MNNTMHYQTPEQQLSIYLNNGHSIWVLYLDVIQFSKVEFRQGYKICNRILEEIEKEINQNLRQYGQLFKTTLLQCRGGDDFVVFFVPRNSETLNLSSFNDEWLLSLQTRINNRIHGFVQENIRLRSGFVDCKPQPTRSADYLLYNAVKEAFLLNKSGPDPQYHERKREIRGLLKEPDHHLTSAYQPILNVKNGSIFGFEALARMKGHTLFANISELFPFAEKIGELYPIETLCRRSAILNSSNVLNAQEYLFINVDPQILTDPDFATGQTRRLLSQKNLKPSNVVLEITERSAIQDFALFREALEHYRSQGFSIALDDVGAGYSSLQSIAEFHPDFIKVDRSLIHSIHSDPTKWALLETFSTFSRRIGCRLLAEGVETEEEMRTVVQLGVDYIQGYFIAKPSFDRPKINSTALHIINNFQVVKTSEKNTILSLVEPLVNFSKETTVQIVDEYFRTHPLIWLIGISDEHRIVGAVHRDKFYTSLGTRYGVSLYTERPISLLMDDQPLMFEDHTPIEVASSIAMTRQEPQVYDGLIVVHQQKPIGMVKMASLIKAMADTQIQIARGANPLTGLPGNIIIEQEIQKWINKRSAFALVYADLNHFKQYNDLYGFQKGDTVIKLLSEILLDASKQKPAKEQAFVGHIGGDDFLLIVEETFLQELCLKVIEAFNKKTKAFPGYENLSVALAGLILSENLTIDSNDIAEQLARIKKKAKSLKTNSYLIESLKAAD